MEAVLQRTAECRGGKVEFPREAERSKRQPRASNQREREKYAAISLSSS